MLGRFFRKAKPDEHFQLNIPDVEQKKHSEIAHLHEKTGDEPEIIVNPPRKPKLSAQNLAILITIVLILLGGLAVWFWMRYSSSYPH